MTAPSRARRHAATVEVMRLDSVEALAFATHWLAAHGIANVGQGAHLYAWTAEGRLVARLGQVLTYDPTTGEFAVLDAAVYDKTHTAAQGVAE